ncbi:MAG: SDR family NAD(P)-dependent oxidoreductase [Bacteroidetes bacterium]|nr:SDR family NAD(P)-dependent oxidoreductase [Bacteroidota bacterium]
MNKVILITGASSGMGKDTAITLAKSGYKVYAAARRIEEMNDILEAGGIPLAADITKEADLQNVIQAIMRREGRIDILWNNAGYGLYGAVEDIPIEEAKRQFEVNLFGLARLTQLVIPYMRNADSGLIINTSSMGGKIYTPLGAWYHASKHALEGWSDCLRLELKDANIHVVILEPGIIKTEFGTILTDPMLKHSGKGFYKNIANQIAEATKKTYQNPSQYSTTAVITSTILKIIKSKKPKTRYRVGKFAKMLVWLRLYFGDRLFDRVILSQIK